MILAQLGENPAHRCAIRLFQPVIIDAAHYEVEILNSKIGFDPLEQAQMMRFEGESWVRFGPIISADSL